MKNFRTFFAFAMFAVASFMMVACSDKDDPAPQPAPEPEPELDVTFEIEVTDITTTGVLITVTPSKDDVLYYFDNVSKEDFTEKYGGDVGAVAEGAFEQMVAMGMTLEEAIETYASMGKDSWRNSGGLTPDTEYVAYAVAISNEGKALSEGQSFEYRTLAEEQPAVSDMTFDIEVTDVTSTGATMSVTPSRDDIYYYSEVTPKGSFEAEYGGDFAAFVEAKFAWYNEMLPEYTIEELVQSEAPKGKHNREYSNLAPNTEYVAFAVPMSSDGKALSEGEFVTFRTLPEEAPDASDMTFEIVVTDITSTEATVSVTPSRDDIRYCYGVVEKEWFETAYGGSCVAMVEDMFQDLAAKNPNSTMGEIVQMMAPKGKQNQKYFLYSSPDREYIAYAVPVSSDGRALSEGEFVTFRTLPEEEPDASDMTFEIEVTDITSTEATVSVTPSRDDIYYYSEVAPKELFEAEYGGDFAAFVEARFTWYDEIYPEYTIEELVQLLAKKGEYSNIHSDFTPDTEYVVFTVPVSGDGKALSEGELVTFRTLPEEAPDESDMTFEIEVTDITSTNALVTVTPSRDDQVYYFSIVDKDLFEGYFNGSIAAVVEFQFDESKGLSMEEMLESYGVLGAHSIIVGLNPDTEYVVLAVPVSSDGKALSEGELVTFRTLAE